MIKANFNTYASYVTDSLYQWDINQVLSVSGLNLAVVPEVHFSNAITDRAIVRQATMVNHVVSVAIPNSLLQDPFTIRAHIGIYEGNTFKVVELVEIPIIARKRPSDYQIEDADEEIYSFKALENHIANMVKLSEFNANNTAIAARIDNIIAHNNDTAGNTELVDMRTDINGTVHSTAGGAVRAQIVSVYKNATALKTVTPVKYTIGTISEGVTGYHAARARFVDKIPAVQAVVTFVANSVYQYGYARYDENGVFDGVDHGWNSFTDAPLLLDGGYFKMNFKRIDNATISDDDLETLASYVTVTQFNILSELDKLKSALTDGLEIKEPFTVEIGSLVDGNEVDMANRARFVDKIAISDKTVVSFASVNDYLYGYAVYDNNGIFDGVDHGWTNFYDHPSVELSDAGYVRFNFRRVDDVYLSESDLKFLTENVTVVSKYRGDTVIKTIRELSDDSKVDALNSIDIEYGRKNGASYVFARIPKTTNSGNTLKPKLRLTSEDNSLTGTKVSALTFARKNDKIFTLNAGLFNTTTLTPVGQTIIDGVSLVNTPMVDDMGTVISDSECYPLCIDAAGNLSAPYDRNVNTANMIADGVVFAVTGWGKIVDNFEVCSDTVENEIVHSGTYIRQSIGQFQNGDYFVCTVDQSRGAVENEAGITYADLAELLVDKGVKFAYSLDGGGSAETVIGMRQLNPIYEGAVGRSVPTVIVFELE